MINNTIRKIFALPNNSKKWKIEQTTTNIIEEYNHACDIDYNRRYPSNPSKFEKIDKFNDGLEGIGQFADNYTKIPYGLIGSTHGRSVRQNYQDIYARNPIPDKFDRAFDSYKKATEYDY